MPTVRVLNIKELGDLMQIVNTSPFANETGGSDWTQNIHDDDETTEEEGRAKSSVWD